MDLDELRRLAVAAADAAAAVIGAAAAPGLEPIAAERKGHGDYVTETDRRAQEAALGVLRQGAPGIAVLAEESAAAGAQLAAGRAWVVDPLDGTTNFLRGYPVVGVSVALVEDGVPLAGAVAAPLLGAAWSAARGRGAHDAQGRRLCVRDDDGDGIGSTGFPFRRPDNLPRYLPVLEAALVVNEDLRRAGAACLDLAYAAQGTFDGFFELGLSIWDVAAGALLLTEAGGVVTDWDGDERAWVGSGDILAGAPRWHARMLEVCRRAATAAVAP